MSRTRRYIVLIGLLVFTLCLTSCRPKGILSSREMRKVLIDLHKTDALLQVSGYNRGYDEQKNYYYAIVLDKHGVTQAEFDSSLVWYTAHPQLFDKIYPKVIKEIQAEREAFETAHAEELTSFSRDAGGEHSKFGERHQSATLSHAQLDSIIWVTLYGQPTMWNPYPEEEEVSVVPYR